MDESRETPEERASRYAEIIQRSKDKASEERAQQERKRSELYAKIARISKRQQEAVPRDRNLFTRAAPTRKPLTNREWGKVALEAEALAMSEWMRRAQLAELAFYRERGTDDDRERLTRLMRNAQREIRAKWGDPIDACGVVGDALVNAGRGGMWEEMNGIMNRAARRLEWRRRLQEHGDGMGPSPLDGDPDDKE